MAISSTIGPSGSPYDPSGEAVGPIIKPCLVGPTQKLHLFSSLSKWSKTTYPNVAYKIQNYTRHRFSLLFVREIRCNNLFFAIIRVS